MHENQPPNYIMNTTNTLLRPVLTLVITHYSNNEHLIQIRSSQSCPHYILFSWVRNRNENQRERIGDGGKIQGDGGENDDDVWFGYGNGRQGQPIRAF